MKMFFEMMGGNWIYEGHDVARIAGQKVDPKSIDQPWELPSGKPTENGKFADACGTTPPHRVRVYEKLRDGIWSDRGLFDLTKYEYVHTGMRRVFRFHMTLSDALDEVRHPVRGVPTEPRRVIPSSVKQEVYKRDKGKCVICGETTELHFDHDFPFARGGTGLTAANVRILCARHNLLKADRIE